MREVSSALAWAGYFLTFAAVKTTDRATRDLLTYRQLVLREVQRHSGPGWLEYDRIFQQHAALNPSTQWSELNLSLHASTILSFRSGPSLGCGLCHEPDHASGDCAMKALFPQSVVSAIVSGHPPVPIRQLPAGGPIRRISRPETLERICMSWNWGRCTFPQCNFRHICATCKKRGYRAKDCPETPADSSYTQPSMKGVANSSYDPTTF